jgi:hypothetical protein
VKTVFGGLMPVEPEPCINVAFGESDPTPTNFFLILKILMAKRFPPKVEKTRRKRYCYHDSDPNFRDIKVSDGCKRPSDGFTYCGRICSDDTGLSGKTIFTGSYQCEVKEIEVLKL